MSASLKEMVISAKVGVKLEIAGKRECTEKSHNGILVLGNEAA